MTTVEKTNKNRRLLDKADVYAVGGYVRDRLLDITPQDCDYVVVGATPKQMIDLGFECIGADFPVFLDSLGFEYALARTERKDGSGYHGFVTNASPSVSLKDDLFRRDLTINAIAQKVVNISTNGFPQFDDDRVFDPCKGKKDLKKGIIRHTSKYFKEDPVRVLRAARFAAKYDFSIANSTWRMIKKMVESGEVDHLVPERVWLETQKALTGPNPNRFFKLLYDCGATRRIFDNITLTDLEHRQLFEKPSINAEVTDPIIDERFAVMFINSGVSIETIKRFGRHFNISTNLTDFAYQTRFLFTIINTTVANRYEMIQQWLKQTKADQAIGASNAKWQIEILSKHTSNTSIVTALDQIVNQYIDIKASTLFNSKEIREMDGREIGQKINEARLDMIKRTWQQVVIFNNLAF